MENSARLVDAIETPQVEGKIESLLSTFVLVLSQFSQLCMILAIWHKFMPLRFSRY